MATDPPLLLDQLKKIVQKILLGVGIIGGRGSNSSGDIFLAFSNTSENAFNRNDTTTVKINVE
jgi:D-aminopeptidase